MATRTAHWPPQHELPFRWTVPAHPLALSVVRRGATAVGDVCGTESAEVVGLILTELLTNAIRHAGLSETDRVEVALEVDSAVRGWVADNGGGFASEPTGPTPDGEGGFGLHIVGQLARRWGIEREGDTTKVWFEL